MKKQHYNETNIIFTYPNSWQIEQDKNVISLYDPINGVGSIQFSIYYASNSQNISLKDELEDYVSDKHNKFVISVNDLYACTNYLLDEDGVRYWKYWLFIKDNMLVFASYNCEKEDYGKEEKIVDEIMNAL
ncbi:hypothetical protein GO495_15050 [Chitinophaga oryziterrae]|uniref:Uncharacterized protein n=1 Tax=Chitinophaga oryziterrae TaxID=1031224 RepID=A0A6N8JC51_9BACT|nr:DUF3805 domain-containing protein [Chitinophaga oryziterrae]MVT41906.1 hypothetical protein [Chitinophaga oryziterrae]